MAGFAPLTYRPNTRPATASTKRFGSKSAKKPRSRLTFTAPDRLNPLAVQLSPVPSGTAQPKLTMSAPGDRFEREADRVTKQVVRLPEPAAGMANDAALLPHAPGRQPILRRECTGCEDELSERVGAAPTVVGFPGISPFREPVNRINTKLPPPPSLGRNIALARRTGGQPMPPALKDSMGPRFGANFSTVRVHHDPKADALSRSLNAKAFTVGNDVFFRRGEFQPNTSSGQRLIAHELTHVVQQGAALPIRPNSVAQRTRRPVPNVQPSRGPAQDIVQLFPGDGMMPPGDCSWAKYLALRGSVETAKAIVSTLGRCRPGDSCLLLATKIAATTAEIAARMTLMTKCFRGGDREHRDQVDQKVNMMNRCYRFFSASGCSPELIARMAVVVEAARAAVAAAAFVTAVAFVVALVLAIIALVKAIAAAAAAVGAATAVAAGATAIAAVLALVLGELRSEEPPEA